MRFYFLFIFNFSLLIACFSQTNEEVQQHKTGSGGVSAQVYPAGYIIAVYVDLSRTTKTSFLIRTGWNFIDRKDFSHYNDHEEGNGIGMGVSYRRHFFLHKGEIMAAINTDVWNEWIDWENNIGQINQASGKTYTLVLQPWLETGYFTGVNKSSLKYGITAGFGREINVVTDGKDVGQGWILSGLLHLQYLIKK